MDDSPAMTNASISVNPPKRSRTERSLRRKPFVKPLRNSLLVAVPSMFANGAISASIAGSSSPAPSPWKYTMFEARSAVPRPPSWL